MIIYWDSYIDLHKKIGEEIQASLEVIEKHSNFKILPKSYLTEFNELFDCETSLTMPDSIQDEQFNCNSCMRSYSVLKVSESNIAQKLEEILEFLNTGKTMKK